MPRPLLLALGAVLVLSGCSSSSSPACMGPPPQLDFRTTGHPSLIVEIADTPSERGQGLMDRSRLVPDHGMAFVYDAPSTDWFWMKDTEIPLSIAFWGASGRIQQIFDMAPCVSVPCHLYRAAEPFVGAVEAPQGYFSEHGVRVGDEVRLHLNCS